MAEMMYSNSMAGGDIAEENNSEYFSSMNSNNSRPRNPGLYVGNLTWWTTDQDVINAINSVGVKDVQEVKFFENRNNGQSKGFCVVTFTSDSSLPIVMEKLPKLELHGQNPVVTPYNRQNLNLFESQTKTRPQINPSSNGPNSHAAGIMGISSISGVHAATQGIPYSGMNTYNQAGAPILGGPRQPTVFPGMRMQTRLPRHMMPGMPNPMNNGSMMGPVRHQMPRMRFMQHQGWNNSQAGAAGAGGGYNQVPRMPQVSMELSNRLSGGKPDDTSTGQDILPSQGSQNYYAPHHSSSQSDHYRSDPRDLRDIRDDRDGGRRIDDRSMRPDDRREIRHDDRAIRQDDRSMKLDDRGSLRSRDERSSRRDEGSSSRREESSSRREDRSDRSSRREKESSRREKSHRDERPRSRSRERSRERKRDRRERY